MELEVILGVIAGLMHLVGFVFYNLQIWRGQSIPNSTTWTLSAFLSTLNCLTYLSASGDLVKSILPIVSTLACVATFFFALHRGKLSKLDNMEKVLLGLGLASAIVWLILHSAAKANLILQASIAIAFVATFRSVWRNPKSEKALSWFIWSSAYVLSITVVIWRWQGQWIDLVYPINCLFLHGIVGLLTFRKQATSSGRSTQT